MNFQTRTFRTLCFTFAAALTCAGVASAADAPKGKGAAQGNMMKEHCQQMMEQKAKMKEEMKAQDAQLTEQVTAMNRAPDDKKLALVTALLTTMVEQRVAMTIRHEKMEMDMMDHMKQHADMGKGSMNSCPMMNGMHASSAGHSGAAR